MNRLDALEKYKTDNCLPDVWSDDLEPLGRENLQEILNPLRPLDPRGDWRPVAIDPASLLVWGSLALFWVWVGWKVLK